MFHIISILAPVFIIMALGYGFGRTRLFNEQSSEQLINYVWYIAIPALLFRSIASAPLPAASEVMLILAYYGGLLTVYFTGVIVARAVFKLPLAEQGMFAFISCFANGGFVGIPILYGAYGDEGVRLLLVLLSVHSLLLLTLTTLFVETDRGAQAGGPTLFVRTLVSVKDNPVLIALLIGLAWTGLGVPYPDILDRILELPAASASPVGLFAVGLAMTRIKVAGDIGQASVAMVLNNMLMPSIVFVSTHYIFSLQPLWVGIATLMAALPAGLIPYSYAIKQNVAPRRTASALLMSVVAAPVTLFVVMALLGVGK